VPVAKSILEKLIYSVKGMLVLNDSATAFWMGNLVNKNLDGREILSQVIVILIFISLCSIKRFINERN
jgi:Fanconi anemia group D2 protein